MVLKCADIGHLAAGPRTHKRWAVQLEEEFFRQGDRERAHGLPLSPLMDRSTQGGMTRSQVDPSVPRLLAPANPASSHPVPPLHFGDTAASWLIPLSSKCYLSFKTS